MIITKNDMVLRFGEDELIALTDRNGLDVIDDDVLNQAMSDGSEEAMTYVNAAGLGGYVVALPSQPKALIIRVCDIARYYLSEDSRTETIKERYDQAIEWLKLVKNNPSMLDPNNDSGATGASVSTGFATSANTAMVDDDFTEMMLK